MYLRVVCFFLACFLFALLALLGIASPSDSKNVESEVLAVRKASESAEVHGVAVETPAVDCFVIKDFADWPKLVNALRDRKKSAGRVWSYLSDDTRRRVSEDGIVEKFSAPKTDSEAQAKVGRLRAELFGDLNRILDKRDFYEDKEFKGLALDDSVKDLVSLGHKRTSYQTAVMNWGLLRATFPGSIPELPAGFRIVRVQVRDGADVVLVLSCGNNCRWEVDVRRGGKVSGIVLCGNYSQELEVFENPIKAPVVYRARHRPDGTDRHEEGEKYLRCTGPKDKVAKEKWQPFAEGVKAVTGKEFTLFQWDSTASSDPYVIAPKAK